MPPLQTQANIIEEPPIAVEPHHGRRIIFILIAAILLSLVLTYYRYGYLPRGCEDCITLSPEEARLLKQKMTGDGSSVLKKTEEVLLRKKLNSSGKQSLSKTEQEELLKKMTPVSQ